MGMSISLLGTVKYDRLLARASVSHSEDSGSVSGVTSWSSLLLSSCFSLSFESFVMCCFNEGFVWCVTNTSNWTVLYVRWQLRQVKGQMSPIWPGCFAAPLTSLTPHRQLSSATSNMLSFQASLFSPHCSSSLSCVNEHMAMYTP